MQKKLSEGVTCFLIDGYPRELEQGERFEKEVGYSVLGTPLPWELEQEERLGKGIRYSVIGTPPRELEQGERVEKR